MKHIIFDYLSWNASWQLPESNLVLLDLILNKLLQHIITIANCSVGSRGNRMGNLITKLDASKADFDQMKSLKGDLVLQNIKVC